MRLWVRRPFVVGPADTVAPVVRRREAQATVGLAPARRYAGDPADQPPRAGAVDLVLWVCGTATDRSGRLLQATPARGGGDSGWLMSLWFRETSGSGHGRLEGRSCMPTQTRSVMIRTEACRALLHAAKLLQNVKAMADAVPPGRKHPTPPHRTDRHQKASGASSTGGRGVTGKGQRGSDNGQREGECALGSTDMTPQERVRSALSRAMLDTPGGRDEMDSFVAQVVIAAAELAAIFDEPATEKLFGETLKRLEQRFTDNPGSWICDRTSCGCLAVAAGWTRAGDEAVEFFKRVNSAHRKIGP